MNNGIVFTKKRDSRRQYLSKMWHGIFRFPENITPYGKSSQI